MNGPDRDRLEDVDPDCVDERELLRFQILSIRDVQHFLTEEWPNALQRIARVETAVAEGRWLNRGIALAIAVAVVVRLFGVSA